MYHFSVGGNTYKVRYSYGVLYKSDVMDRVINATAENDDVAQMMKNLIGLTAELLLEGLQKYHSDRFGYETPEERETKIRAVCELIDDYEDEHTNEDGTRDADGFTLFNDLQAELERNGFLSKITAMAATMNDQSARKSKNKAGATK